MNQECHNLEVEYLVQAMFNMSMNVIQLKTGIESALAIAITSIPKEKADLRDWEFTRTPIVVADVAMDLERPITKGKKKLSPNEDPEDKDDGDNRAR